MTLLEVESLTKRYGSITAVDDLSFSVAPGETLGLLGPNGAGKTTTMGCIVGLLEPAAGRIAIDGLAPKSKTVSAMVGYAAQRTALYLSLRVSENLAYFGGLYGLRGRALAEAVAKIIDLFDLDSLTGRRVNDLSVGQAKLVHLASAVIHEPTLLLVDEPTAGLDVSARRRVIDAIRRLATQGTAVIFSTHYLEEADEACDSLVIIDHGRRVAAGPLGDLLATDPDPATIIRLGNGDTVSFDDRDLMAAINSVDQDQIAEVVVERPSVRRLYERVIDSSDADGAGTGNAGTGNASTEADSNTGDDSSSADG
ncbi:ABC transporter ATP-binding protein [Candidatus Poriferisodalis sp.]|uniref:ABC transporter ATP-binding protein n=1 Tax=Candidatus Poriferisodalis sp. TaxID=3101277 RepID=UPI003B0266B8